MSCSTPLVRFCGSITAPATGLEYTLYYRFVFFVFFNFWMIPNRIGLFLPYFSACLQLSQQIVRYVGLSGGLWRTSAMPTRLSVDTDGRHQFWGPLCPG